MATTSTDMLTARDVATKEVERDRAHAAERIADLHRRDKEAIKRADRASKTFHKLADKDPTMTYSVKDGGTRKPTKLGLAWRELQMAMAAIENIGDALAQERSRLSKLNDEAEIDRRMESPARTRGTGPRTNNGGPVAELDYSKVPASTIDLIKKGIEAGDGAGNIGRQLDGKGLKAPDGSTWNFRKVRDAIEHATGKSWFDLKDAAKAGRPARKPAASKTKAASKPASKSTSARATGASRTSGSAAKKPAARKPASKPKAASKPASKTAAKTAPSKPASKRSSQAKPLDKAAQAAGTSRGGTGTRKTKAPAETRKWKGQSRKK